MTLHVVEHPLVAHYLTRLRDRETTPDEFREASDKIITLLLYEATRDLRTRTYRMQTPLEETDGHAIGDRVVAVPILRAGLGLVGPVLELLPHVTVGYIGLERDERTAIASRYYVKLPPDIAGKAVMILDPMLATGGTALKAVEIMKEYKPASVRLVCVVAAPEGIQALQAAHPDVQIFTAARDRELDVQKYILPGLGDYGDRLFGTCPPASCSWSSAGCRASSSWSSACCSWRSQAPPESIGRRRAPRQRALSHSASASSPTSPAWILALMRPAGAAFALVFTACHVPTRASPSRAVRRSIANCCRDMSAMTSSSPAASC